MNWLYTFKKHTEVVTDEQKVEIRRVTKSGNFTPIAVIPTPPEALEVIEKATKKVKEKTEESDPNK